MTTTVEGALKLEIRGERVFIPSQSECLGFYEKKKGFRVIARSVNTGKRFEITGIFDGNAKDKRLRNTFQHKKEETEDGVRFGYLRPKTVESIVATDGSGEGIKSAMHNKYISFSPMPKGTKIKKRKRKKAK